MTQTITKTPAPQKSSGAAIISNAQNAVAGTPPLFCTPNCQQCTRVDLQLLVVTPSVVPEEFLTTLNDAGYHWQPRFDPEFNELKRSGTVPVARITRAGFIVVLNTADERVTLWKVDDFGLTRQILYQVNAAQYGKMIPAFQNATDAKSCSRQAANLVGSLISIPKAPSVAEAWIAFTPRLWPQEVLQRFIDNPTITLYGPDDKKVGDKPLRDVMGRTIRPASLLTGERPPTHMLPLDGPHLQQYVADFAPVGPDGQSSRAPQPAGWQPMSIKGYTDAFHLAIRPLQEARFGKADTLASNVRHLERASGPGNNRDLYLNRSTILMVPDAVGVAEQHNIIRLATLSAHQGWMAGGPDAKGRNADPTRPWQRQSQLHAAYIREWVRNEKHDFQKRLLAGGGYKTTQIISAHEYTQIKAQEQRTGKPYHPKGTTYEKLPSPPERYRVRWPEDAVQQGIKNVAMDNAKAKVERYNDHIDWTRVDAANKTWLAQEKGWLDLILERDADFVAWLDAPVLKATLRYTHLDNSVLARNTRDKDKLTAHLLDAAACLEDTAICYAGGAVTEKSLKHLVAQLEKNFKDPEHWIAQAMLGQFGLWDKVLGTPTESADTGLRADLYDSALALRTLLTETSQATALASRHMAQHTQMLRDAAMQVQSRMEEMALDARKAKMYGLSSKLETLKNRRGMWVKATALQEYIDSGVRHFYVDIAIPPGRYLNMLTDAMAPPAFDLKPTKGAAPTGRAQKAASLSAKAELARVIEEADAKGLKEALTVPVLLREHQIAELLKKSPQGAGKSYKVVGGNLLGLKQAPITLPEETLKQLFKEQAQSREALYKRWQDTALTNALDTKGLVLVQGAVIALQWFAFQKSLDDMSKKGGWDQVDATASALGAAFSMVGATLEVGAALLTPSTLTRAGTVSPALMVSQMPKAYLRLGLGAGILGAGGAMTDGVASLAKAKARLNKGDEDSAFSYRASTAFHFAGAGSLMFGALASYRSALFAQAGITRTVQVLSTRMALSSVGSLATGIGLWLWFSGIAWQVLAAYYENDRNEEFLDRSFFGKHKNTQGRPFQTLDDEVNALAALSRGHSAEVEWEDNLLEADVVTVRLKTAEWDRQRRGLSFLLEGYDQVNGKLLGALAWAEMYGVAQNQGLYESTHAVKVPQGVKAVKLTFRLWDTTHRSGDLPLEPNPKQSSLPRPAGAVLIGSDIVWAQD